MKIKKLLCTALSSALALCLILTPMGAVSAVEAPKGLSFEQVDNSEVDSKLIRKAVAVESEDSEKSDSMYKDSDIVRVSIILSENSVIDAGYGTEEILDNSAALSHLKKVKKNQKNLEKKIAKAAKKSVKVKHNLGLVANIISAEITYGDIEKIEAVSGVEDVVIETQYEPNGATVVDSPNMAISTENMTGAAAAWSEGYTGKGARIAIIDTGLDIDHQSFDNDAFLYAINQSAKVEVGNKGKQKEKKPNMNKLDLLATAEIKEALPYLNAYAALDGNVSAEDLFISDKIPFGFNYVDGNNNVRHIYDSQGEHGSHVAGIAAANRFLNVDGEMVDALATVGVAGNAPDAQVIVMKVFGQGGGAYDSDYMAAIEDAILLGCDSVNLSLGSGNAGMATSGQYEEIMDKITSTDTVVVMSAGNSGAWADETTYGELYNDGVNFDTAGSPGSFKNSLGVASVDNDGMFGVYFEVAGNRFVYNESATYGNAPMATLATDGNKDYDYVFIDGVGTADDFANIDVDGKVVFCKRGEISFFEKANNAVAAGAIATVIYNNQPGTIGLNLTGYEYTAPCVSISEDDGALIKKASKAENGYYTGTITVSAEATSVIYNSDHYTMSSFSSWGVPGNLSLKPEITAPGGNIYSVNGTNNAGGGVDQYELMSGTSMAAPQITGMTAVLKRYIEEKNVKTVITYRALAQSLLMSTATPLSDANGNKYSVMKQGAGLANVSAAMKADTYVTMGADATVSSKDGKVKAELGDDPSRNGVYSFSFTLNNISKSNVTYKLDADMFTQAFDEYFLYGDTASLDANVTFTVNGAKANTVTVKKNKNATVKVTIALTADSKAVLNTAKEGGAYVEGYIYAEPTNGSSTHSIPVLGYYGSWTDPSMFDKGSFNEYSYDLEQLPPYLYAENDIYGNAYTVNFADGSGEYYFGGNLFAEEEEYHPEYASLNNENGDTIKSAYYTLIRNAGNTAMVISDATTGEIYSAKTAGSQYSAYYYANGAKWNNVNSKMGVNWAGTDANGKALPEGTKVDISLVAVPEYYCAADGSFDLSALGEGAFFSTNLTIDNTAPVVEAVSDAESGNLGVIASDNVAISAIALFSQNGREQLGSVAVGESEIAALLGRGLEDDIYLIAVFDYAGNMSTYRVFMNVETVDKAESVTLDKSSVVLMKNNSAKLSATVEPYNISDGTVVWSSDDESVATVNENGVVTGVAVGSCTVKAASVLDPSVYAECEVEVISIEKDLNAVVWDENGEVWFSELNTAKLPNYTKIAGVKAPVNGLAYGSDGTLYATDIDTENGISNLYKVGSDFSLDMIGTSSIAYTDVASAPSLGDNLLIGTYFNYVVLIDAETGDYVGAFDYCANDLVGITYEGSMYNPNYGTSMDIFLMLDSEGNLYEEAFINLAGSYYYFMGSDDALLGKTGITCDVSYFQSLYADDEYAYASCFNEAKNTVTLYVIDVFGTGSIYNVGEFADGVWPVAALCNLSTNSDEVVNAAKFENAKVKDNAVTSVSGKHSFKIKK